MTKRDALCECEVPMSPSIFAVQTIPETCATTVRTRSGSPHNQSEIQDDPTTRLASSMRRRAVSIRTVGSDLSQGLTELVDLVAKMVPRLRIDDGDRGRDREPRGMPDCARGA